MPFFDKLVELSEQRPDTGAMILRRDRAQRFLVGFTWLCLVLAAAKPQWIGPPIEQQKSGRDLMVAVDLSGSMEVSDFTLPTAKPWIAWRRSNAVCKNWQTSAHPTAWA